MLNKKMKEKITSGQSYWYNFIILVLDSGGFNFAANMLSHLTIIPYYLSELSNSNIVIGMAQTIYVLGTFMPQVFIANYVNGLERRKRYIVKIVVAQRIGILSIFLSVLIFAKQGGFLAISTFLLAFAIFTITNGLMSPAHTDLVARSITRKRGIFYGVSFFIGGICGIMGAQLATRFLEMKVFPVSYYYIFGLALIVPMMTMVFWYFIKEPKYQYQITGMKTKEYFKHLVEIIKTEKEYSKFLLVRTVLNLCEIATPFYIVYAKLRFGISAGTVGLFTMVTIISQTVSHLIWGYIGEHFGFKRVLQMVAVLGVTATIIALIVTNVNIFYLVFVLVGAMYSSVQVANVNLAIEFSKPNETPTYVGLMNTFQAPALALAPLIGGLLADNYGYRLTFFVGLLLFSFSVVFCSIYMKDPRQLKKEVV
jgi:MFS family permease